MIYSLPLKTDEKVKTKYISKSEWRTEYAAVPNRRTVWNAN